MKFEDIKVDALIKGLIAGKAVKIIAVNPYGQDVYSLIYKDEQGTLGDQMVYRVDANRLSLVEEGRPWSFDGDGENFRLAAEAFRIKLAHLFDPLLAVHTSDVEPLPHQITAVYESMLPRQPLRFLLADDPGAGKTIMAGLLIRELMLRGDVKRCLIISPGSLVDQWQDELDQKFGLTFDIFTKEMVETNVNGNPFADGKHNLLICRLDQLSRNENLQEKLENSEWDLVVFDEAHKLSASFQGNEVKRTKRFRLGELVGNPKVARHMLLMTATPHNGKEEDFQLFLSLLDSDRFYGKFRDGVHQVDTSDIMRRMVKEDLVRFDGTKLFPERIAYTSTYKLSDPEAALYEEVTKYVRDEMNRAENLDKGRRGTVGFALTILQRRLASSPEAIYRSLERRRKNLEKRLAEQKLSVRGQQALTSINGIPDIGDEDWDEFLDDKSGFEAEELEEQVVDLATAARTIKELEAEIFILKKLEEQAFQVKISGKDKKWEELSNILLDEPEMRDANGNRRKLIIFTEHRDTLSYLAERIRNLIGNDSAVAIIHGGTKREERKVIQEKFTQDKDVLILLATDAAGEGINLQRANLMVNYDLPWNPNRIEQRFGRIHRIGQTEVCHLWNLVAFETREGAVFQRLFDKLEVERETFQGRVFDVLGEVFSDTSLKSLLMEAIRYGDNPQVKQRLFEKVEGALDEKHLRQIIERNALATEHMDVNRLYAVKEEMEKYQARKLQPHFIRSFFLEAFNRLNGQISQRETERYEINHVPASIRERDRIIGSGQPVLRRYQRICFDKDKIRQENKPMASFVCPGHPLLDSVIDLTLENHQNLLKRGTILVDPTDEGTEPRVMLIIDHSIREGNTDNQGQPFVISRRLQFIQIDSQMNVTNGGYAPYLDYRPAEGNEINAVKDLFNADWVTKNLENNAINFAANSLVPEHLGEVKSRQERIVDTTLKAVKERLIKEINYWTHQAAQLQMQVSVGNQPRMQPENARRRAEELTARLRERELDLEARRHVISNTPLVIGGALIIPQGLLNERLGTNTPDEFALDPEARKRVEKLAMQAVISYEESQGYRTEDVSAQKCGWDVTSHSNNGEIRFLEVKGRVKGAPTVTVTRNEILTSLNQPDKFILAIVLVDGNNAESPVYIRRPFQKEPEFGVTSINYDVNQLISLGEKIS